MSEHEGLDIVEEAPLDSEVDGEPSPETYRLASIIESLLFVADKPLTIRRLKTVLESDDTVSIRRALGLLEAQYLEPYRGLSLECVNNSYQLRTKSDNAEFVLELNKAKPQRLSRPALESLAIVSYKQPLTRHEVEEIRGVDCGGVLRTLLEKDLVKIMGKKDEPGNPLLYGTTDYFLTFFGIKNLRDLPSLREYAELQEGGENLAFDLTPPAAEMVENGKLAVEGKLDLEGELAEGEERVVEMNDEMAPEHEAATA